ncbi:MAG: hypothetical protein JRN24_01135, partial [Nitrososphaerota archaeon]|nr:hypothetical protein [Nitrososphaerota archaeon]
MTAQPNGAPSKCLMLASAGPAVANASTLSQSFHQEPFCPSAVSVTLYFKQVVSNGYVSPNLKVVIAYSFASGGGSIYFTFLNPKSFASSCQPTRLMYGSSGFDWSDSASAASFDCRTSTLTYASLPASGVLDPKAVATSASGQVFGVFSADSLDWAFFTDGTNLVCATSGDSGNTWSGTAVVRAAAYQNVGIWHNSTYFAYAYVPEFSGTVGYYRLGRLSPSGCGSITY